MVMKKTFFSVFLLFLAMTLSAQNWKPSTASVGFKIKMFGAGVEGTFKGFVGTVVFNPNNLATASINATVDAKTIDTDNGLRNRHLRDKEEFFDAAKYPTIRMKSVKIEKSGDGFIGYFDLTMKATTKNIKIPFTFVQTSTTAQFKGNFTINRRDWKVGGGTLGLSDDVAVTLTLNATQ
jgi:polyisoprenoid-binding protein YceI